MTISEYLMSWAIRELSAGRQPTADAPPLVCASGLTVLVRPVRGQSIRGPWHTFEVEHVEGPMPDGFDGPFRVPGWKRELRAQAVLRLLEGAGWTPQLGVQWKKGPTPVPPSR